MPSILANRNVRNAASTVRRMTPAMLLKGKKKVSVGRPCLSKSMQSVIRNLRKDGATLLTIARVCDVCLSTAIKYSWCVPHKNRLDVSMTVNRRTGVRVYR